MRLNVRKAKIPIEEREVFERYGETVIALVIAVGQYSDKGQELNEITQEPLTRENAALWLQEKADLRLLKEWLGFFVQAAILLVALMTLWLQAKSLGHG
jgi:hypothetical protein